MRFTTVSKNDIVSRVVSVTLAIMLAQRGWGYRALIAGVVGQTLAQALGAWYLCRWIPGLPRRAAGTRSVVSFAMSVYGRFSVNYFSRNVDNLLVGWRFGATALGFYKKAYDLFALSAGQLTAPLTNVAVAALSRFNPRSEEYRQHLMMAFAILALVGMGLSGVVTLVGTDLITLLLGPGWEPTGKIFTYFGPGIGAVILYYIHGWIHLSIGRADRWLRWGMVELVATSLCFLAALRWGPAGVALAWTASLWLLLIPAFWYALSPVEIGVSSVVGVIWKYIAAALLAVLGYSWIAPRLGADGWSPSPHDLFWRIVWTLVLYTALYLGIAIALHRRWLPLPEFSQASLGALSQVTSGLFPASNPAASADPSLTGDKTGPLVSILIPAYNAQAWLADSLRSALAQTWEPKEIIVVDDGSKDRTLAIAKSFESDTVRILVQNNQGAAAARNTAFSVSRGDYIQWLDADDLLAPDKIARQMEAIRQCQNTRIVCTCAFGTFANRHYRAKFTPTDLWRDLSPVEWLLNKMSGNVYMQTGTWLVSRELTQAAGPWDKRLLGDDDGEYFGRLLLAADSIRFVPEAKAYYRLPHRNSLSYVGLSGRKREAQWISMELHIRYLRSLEDTPRTRAACVQYLQNAAILFYPTRSDIFNSARQMANDLGGRLEAPILPWKYAWIQKLFGWQMAERVLVFMPTIRWSLARLWDQVLYQVDRLILRRELSHDPPSGIGSEGKGSWSASPPLPFREPDLQMAPPKDTCL